MKRNALALAAVCAWASAAAQSPESVASAAGRRFDGAAQSGGTPAPVQAEGEKKPEPLKPSEPVYVFEGRKAADGVTIYTPRLESEAKPAAPAPKRSLFGRLWASFTRLLK